MWQEGRVVLRLKKYKNGLPCGHPSPKMIIFASDFAGHVPPDFRGGSLDRGSSAFGIAPKAFCQSSCISKSPVQYSVGRTVEDAHYPAAYGCGHSVVRPHIRIRTWGDVFFKFRLKGVWRYLIYKDVEQRSLTSLAFLRGSVTAAVRICHKNEYSCRHVAAQRDKFASKELGECRQTADML